MPTMSLGGGESGDGVSLSLTFSSCIWGGDFIGDMDWLEITLLDE